MALPILAQPVTLILHVERQALFVENPKLHLRFSQKKA